MVLEVVAPGQESAMEFVVVAFEVEQSGPSIELEPVVLLATTRSFHTDLDPGSDLDLHILLFLCYGIPYVCLFHNLCCFL